MEECCICLDHLETDVAVLECLHKFHFKCAAKWIKHSSICPICREEMILLARVDAISVANSIKYIPHRKKKTCTIL